VLNYSEVRLFINSINSKYSLQEQKDEVKKRCLQAEPRHGELWQAASKDVKNWRKRTGELLEIIAVKLEIPT